MSLVQISTAWEGAGGMGGFFERLFAPRVMRGIYAGQLDPLALWAIIETRWPALADFLRSKPNAIESLESTEVNLETLPPGSQKSI